ncbi:MAG: hypothetical protein LBC72_05730 [Spirochaetaceae bacterium]|jgi:clan AA aspartic protease|nr:hypothetical protein [Spirochaetaceae bacterium]
MSLVHTEIVLKNAADVSNAKAGIIEKAGVRQIAVRALVDTGAWTLVINDEIRGKLGLDIMGEKSGVLADGTRAVCKTAGPLEVWWKDRYTICEALILPHAREPLLGAIPLEGLDLTINPAREEVVGAHGNLALYVI